MFITYKKTTRIICTICLIAFIFSSTALRPLSVQAQGQDVPIGTDFDFNNIMTHLKDFVLDNLAETIAKQILHQMTLSIVNWINSGFEGNPSFLTNPEGFFLDAADQITGAFLDTSGPLSRLCSPFSIDIRLSLALNQTKLSNDRYRCTLNTIIKNVENLPKNISVNGRSIEGFMGGDFSQGGWPAFIALTTEPQNNPTGAYLQAKSDLNGRIYAKQNAIHADLQMGSGFLSRNSCKDVTEAITSGNTGDLGLSLNEENQLRSDSFGNQNLALQKTNAGESTYIQKQVSYNDDGSVETLKYQSCETQTPGSVLAGSLQKAVDSPIVEAELANDINAILNAMVSQMITQMLSQGLKSLSHGSNGTPSYTNRVINNINQQTNNTIQRGNAQAANVVNAPASTTLNKYKAYYDQAVTLITKNKTHFESARTCFVSKIASTTSLSTYQRMYGENQISGIDTYVAANIRPALADLTSKQTNALNLQLQLASSTNAATHYVATSTQDLQAQISAYQNALRISITSSLNAAGGLTAAQTDLQKAKTDSAKFSTESTRYLDSCAGFPNNATQYSTQTP